MKTTSPQHTPPSDAVHAPPGTQETPPSPHPTPELYNRVSIGLNRTESARIELANRVYDYEEFIKSIPEYLREELQQRFEQMQEQEQGQYFTLE